MPTMYRNSTPTMFDWRQRKIHLGCGLSLLLIWTTWPASAADKAVPFAGTPAANGKGALKRPEPFVDGRFRLERGDVVAFLGGSDVSAAQHAGHLEALLAIRYHRFDVDFRNFGWEGDTVFAQARDVGFPPLKAHLQQAGASVIVLQFGRAEALSGREALPSFIAAYQKLIEECARQTPRLVLVTPPPFEKGGELLPDLSVRNRDLGAYANAIRGLARQEKLPLVDLFSELEGQLRQEPRLTDNGLQLTPRGHAWVARVFARQVGFGKLADRAGEINEYGAWSNAAFERVREAVVAKNQLWFNYWRPQNWAFLGGDRTQVPSSRDHRDPNVRWFPDEMEKFVPLIQHAEARIDELAHIAAPLE